VASSSAEGISLLTQMPRPAPPPASLLKAKSLTRDVFNHTFEIEKVVAAGAQLRAESQQREQERALKQVRSRMQENLGSIRFSEKRIQGSDEAITKASSCLRKLQHERYARYAALQVCDRRLELRQERPEEEQVKDIAQEALESEQKTLTVARQQLFELEEQARNLLKELSGIRNRLTADAANRRFAVELDRAAIISISTGGGATSAPVHGHDMLEAGADNPLDTKELHKKAVDLEESVDQLCQKTDSKIFQTRQECLRSSAKVENALMHNCKNLSDLGKELKDQAKEVDYTILQAERSLWRNKKKVGANDKVAQSKFDSTTSLLGDLRQTRQMLQNDIACKTVSLVVDENCRKVTPQKASCRRRPASSGARVQGGTNRTLALSLGSVDSLSAAPDVVDLDSAASTISTAKAPKDLQAEADRTPKAAEADKTPKAAEAFSRSNSLTKLSLPPA